VHEVRDDQQSSTPLAFFIVCGKFFLENTVQGWHKSIQNPWGQMMNNAVRTKANGEHKPCAIISTQTRRNWKWHEPRLARQIEELLKDFLTFAGFADQHFVASPIRTVKGTPHRQGTVSVGTYEGNAVRITAQPLDASNTGCCELLLMVRQGVDMGAFHRVLREKAEIYEQDRDIETSHTEEDVPAKILLAEASIAETPTTTGISRGIGRLDPSLRPLFVAVLLNYKNGDFPV
jgi:hypothetical protein